MWKPKIYLGTSIFDMILTSKGDLKECSLLLLEKCREQTEYEGFISAFTIYEMSLRYTPEEMLTIIDFAKKTDIRYIEYRIPKEIDYLAANYHHQAFLPKEFNIEYYHIATCAYLNLEFYVCWNVDRMINFPVFRNILHSHVPRGYRSNIQLESPTYFISRECPELSFFIIENTIRSKITAFAGATIDPIGLRSSYVQGVSNEIVGDQLDKIVLPNEKILPARIPMLNLENVDLKFHVTAFENEIRNKEIPLLDLSYDTIGWDMNYHLFKLGVLAGQELLKNKQLELIYHLPVQYTLEELENIAKDRNKNFIDWILPQIRSAIDDSETDFEEIPRNQIQRYSYREIDYKLATSIWGETIKTIKTKALEFSLFITQNAWQYYQGFSFPNAWCKHNQGYDHGENTHLIFEKDGKEIWVVLINTVIP